MTTMDPIMLPIRELVQTLTILVAAPIVALALFCVLSELSRKR